MHARLGAALAAYRAGGGAVAMVSQPVLEADTVAIDNVSGDADLATALMERGYRSFAVLSGPPGHLTARERLRGFTSGLAGRDDDATEAEPGAPRHVVASAFTRDGGYAAMAELIERVDLHGPEVDAVFAVNDVMAVGAMAAARDAGVRVGVDVGVAGFDDIATLRDVTPSLSTVRVPLHKAGVLATQLALGLPLSDAGHHSDADREGDAEVTTQTGEDGIRHVRVRGTVVLRDSTPSRLKT